MKRIILTLIALALLGAAVYGYIRYQHVFSPSITEGKGGSELFVPSGTDLSGLFRLIEDEQLVENLAALQWVSKRMKMSDQSVKAGRYVIQEEWSNYDLLSTIRSGEQVPMDVIIRSHRHIDEFAAELGSQLETDSASIMNSFQNNEFLTSMGLSQDELPSLIIPNTYEFYWNTNAEELRARLVREHSRFWESNNRSKKASSLKLTPSEVYTLASIVEKETAREVERPTIAGVYLNRIRKNIPLQADPTIIYAHGDLSMRRVLHRHLEIESPYNTYKYRGLPPGPIAMASVNSIDAVLNAEDHNYIFFCARPDNSGLHQFASTLGEHNRNARKFHNWLNSRGIR